MPDTDEGKKMKIKNAPDTGDLKPQDYTDYSSWIDYWYAEKMDWRNSLRINAQYALYRCSKCGRIFTWGKFDGAHVIKENSQDMSMYIYPLCQECNRGKDETPFEAIGQLLLPMPQKKK